MINLSKCGILFFLETGWSHIAKHSLSIAFIKTLYNIMCVTACEDLSCNLFIYSTLDFFLTVSQMSVYWCLSMGLPVNNSGLMFPLCFLQGLHNKISQNRQVTRVIHVKERSDLIAWSSPHTLSHQPILPKWVPLL